MSAFFHAKAKLRFDICPRVNNQPPMTRVNPTTIEPVTIGQLSIHGYWSKFVLVSSSCRLGERCWNLETSIPHVLLIIKIVIIFQRFGKLFQPNKNWMPAYERDALEEASKKQTYTANADENDNNGGIVNEGADCDYVEANGLEWNGNGDPGFTSIDPSSDFDGIVLEEFQRNDVMHRRVSPSLNGHAVANDGGNEFADVKM